MTFYVYILNMNANVVKIMLGVMETWASYGRGVMAIWASYGRGGLQVL